MERLSVLLIVLFQAACLRAATGAEISGLVGEGHWREAEQEISAGLSKTNVSFQTREDLLFQRDRMRRIGLDFDKTREQVLAEARKMVPEITDGQFAGWEKVGTIEFMDIDGTRRYFDRAAANLFRINQEAKALKARSKPKDTSKALYRLKDVQAVISNYDKTATPLNSPKTWRVSYTLSVKPDEVPPGETIRAWLPFPHSGGRQSNIRIIDTDPPRHIETNTNTDLASVYMEKPAAKKGPTEFKIVFEYTSDAFYQPIDPGQVQEASTNDASLTSFMGEEPPEIVFSGKIRKLSSEIVGKETNPYLKARKIFRWVNQHVPWASAREYSTIECLPEYALSHRHGDCGVETMTFMTLCRLNGIPARWETGWTCNPVQDMHDWCEIYLAPYGWVPADVTYGLVDSADKREKWFYLGGIDDARLVLNTDYAQPLYPAKTFFRSEIVDFQRGEVEWRGGNLYFNQWTWDFNAQEVRPDSTSVILSDKP